MLEGRAETAQERINDEVQLRRLYIAFLARELLVSSQKHDRI